MWNARNKGLMNHPTSSVRYIPRMCRPKSTRPIKIRQSHILPVRAFDDDNLTSVQI